MITNRELIEALMKLPLDQEVEIDADGYECDGVSLSVGQVVVLLHEFGLNELHFILPPVIKGDTL